MINAVKTIVPASIFVDFKIFLLFVVAICLIIFIDLKPTLC